MKYISYNNDGLQMGTVSSKPNVYQLLYIILMLSMTFPIFRHIPIFNMQYIFWGIGIFLGVYLANSYFKTTAFWWMLLYTLVVFINYIGGDIYFHDYMSVLKEFIFFFIPATMTEYVVNRGNIRFIKLIIIAFLFFLLEATIVSYYADLMYPTIMRLQSNAQAVDENASLLLPLQRLGMSDYLLPHAMPVIIPGLVCAIKSSQRQWKIVFFIGIFVAWLLSYVSGSFTALLFSTLSLLFSLLIKRDSIKNNVKRLLLIGLITIPIISIKPLQLSILQEIQTLFSSDSHTYKKINDIEETIVFGQAEGGVESREIRYEQTWDAFKENVFIGTNNQIGGHSSIPDRLALLGFFGIIPLLLFLYWHIKYILRFIESIKRLYYLVGLFFAMLMMMTKSMSCWTMWFALFTLLPCLLWIESKETQSHNLKRSRL